MISPQDEALHVPGDSPHWQESFYFNWTSNDGGEFGLTRLGFNPSTGKADAVVVVRRPGRPLFVYAKVGLAVPAHAQQADVSDGLTVGDLTYTAKSPLDTWRIQLAGRNQIDLTWTAFTPAVDFHDSFPGDASLAQAHFEQSGTVSGVVTVDGVRHVIEGLGQRDKSWGVRDWNGLIGWDWIVGQFGPDLSFNATRTDVGGRLESCGYVFHDGVADVVEDVTVSYVCSKVHQPDRASISVHCVSGRTFEIEGRAAGRFPLLKKGLFIEETPATFTMDVGDGPRQGVGVIEHAHHVGALGTLRGLPRLLPVVMRAARGSR